MLGRVIRTELMHCALIQREGQSFLHVRETFCARDSETMKTHFGLFHSAIEPQPRTWAILRRSQEGLATAWYGGPNRWFESIALRHEFSF